MENVLYNLNVTDINGDGTGLVYVFAHYVEPIDKDKAGYEHHVSQNIGKARTNKFETKKVTWQLKTTACYVVRYKSVIACPHCIVFPAG